MNSEVDACVVGSVVIVGASAEVDVVVLSTADVSATVSKVGACIVVSFVVVAVEALMEVKVVVLLTGAISVAASEVGASIVVSVVFVGGSADATVQL